MTFVLASARLLLLLLAALVLPAALHAQDTEEPILDYSPLNATFTTTTVPVTIRVSDRVSLDLNSRSVQLNGSDITHLFTFTSPTAQVGGPWDGWVQTVGTATLTLQPGENVLSATLCDLSGNCNLPWSVTYTSYPGQQGVRVTPDGGQVQLASGTTGTRTFYVKNTWSGPTTFTLQASCREAWTGAALSGCSAPASVTVNGGDSAAVSVNYTAGTTAGREMVMRLAARSGPTVEDAGWVDVTTTGSGSAQVEPLVTRVNLNHGPTTDRSECVTVAVAPGAAYECGDLRVAHALPAHRTVGRTWSPVLHYSSQHAHPMPTVYADVTIPSGAAAPDSVRMSVTLSNGTVHRASFPGSDFTAGVPRRVAVQWDGLNLPTGLYPYDLQVTSHYPGVSKQGSVLPDTLVVVNRHQSGFGAGWWISGWESLKCLDCSTGGSRILWIGGDGSTRVYEPLVSWQSWVAKHPAGPPDTLRLSGGIYTRTLPGGGRIEFDGIGVHVRTVNRLGQTTTFAHTGGRLDTIRVPAPASAGPRRWVLLYSGGHVTHIQTLGAGPNRQVQLGFAGGNLPMTAITDADGKTTWFQYAVGTYSPRMVGMLTRDSTRYTFGWDGAKKLASVRLWMGATEGVDDIVQQFQAGESRGVGASVAASQAYTRMDGPRDDVADHTYLWLTNRGAPRRIRNPEGMETILNRTNAFLPSLVTEVRSQNARGDSMLVQSSAEYDNTTGLLLRSVTHNPRGDLRNDTTFYTWNMKWRRPESVRFSSSRQLTGTAYTAYDPANGNPLWQQVGPDSARRVRYEYVTSGAAAGQLAAIRYPHPTGGPGGSGVDSLYYDALGNLRGTRTPLGYRTVIVRDALGRDSITYTPIDAAYATTEANVIQRGAWSRTTYDVMDQPIHTLSHGPARTHAAGPEGFQPAASAAEQLSVVTTYDDEGRPLTVAREISPNPADLAPQVTTYTYDRAGRKLTEQVGIQLQRFAYNKAGNVIAWTSPRSHAITSEYDVMGRVTKRNMPAVTYSQAPCSTTGCAYPFPYHPNNGTAYVIPADTTVFEYDLLGRMVYARNNDAIVARGYYPNGLIRTDSLRLRQYGGVSYNSHQYGLAYTYDALGRVTALSHPTNLAAQADSFAYDTVTGALSRARDRTGNVFRFYVDLMGRPRSMHLPGSVIDSTGYDLDSRRIRRLTLGPTNPGVFQNDSMIYDARGKLVRVDAAASYQRAASIYLQWYSGLGNLAATDWDNVSDSGWEREEYGTDALGNVVTRRAHDPEDQVLGGYYPFLRNTLDPIYGRVTAMVRVNDHPQSPFHRDESFRTYDRSGNVTHGGQEVEKELVHGREIVQRVESRSYYGADEKLRVFQQLDFRPPNIRNGTWEEYRYDPLGRRVLVRTIEDELCAGSELDCTSAITRFVWAGDQILWELRAPGGSSSDLEATNGTGMKYGRVSYFHAGAIDRPLAIWKAGVGAIIPHQNWRGQFARGTFPNGTPSDCQTYPPVNCVPVRWPGWRTTATLAEVSEGMVTGYEEYWMGSLAVGMRDASGQIYMRNRYYDPATGQFTQTDPIGLAGGLNAYGFAEGDPVTYSDPYGLSAEECCPQWLVDASAGFGDALSFGLTRVVRREISPDGDGVNYESGAYAGGTAAGVAVGVASGVGMAANAGRGATVVSGTARARQAGAAGEAAVGLARNTVRIPSATGSAAYRIPDGLTRTTVSEVKNVARQGLTSQIRDYIAFAQQTGRQFDLYVRKSTQLSGPLRAAIRAGQVNLRFIP